MFIDCILEELTDEVPPEDLQSFEDITEYDSGFTIQRGTAHVKDDEGEAGLSGL